MLYATYFRNGGMGRTFSFLKKRSLLYKVVLIAEGFILKMEKMNNAEDYIISTYDKYNIIALGEGEHHLENSHQFFHKLLDNKNIQDILDVVIVEFANAAQQATLDRYIFGEEVDLHVLKKVWRNSTQCIGRFGEATLYFELLQKIRNINFNLPSDKKIRVLGGDPPIDWTKIKSMDDYFKIGIKRDSFAAELAIEHGIKHSKKVLLIYAEYHITKITDKSRLDMLAKFGVEHHDDVLTITHHINTKYPGHAHVIAILDPAKFQLTETCEPWPLYSIVNLSSDTMGTLPGAKYFTGIFDNTGQVTLFEGHEINKLFDAFLYIGPSEMWTRVDYPKSVFSDDAWNELNRRRKVLGHEALNDSLK